MNYTPRAVLRASCAMVLVSIPGLATAQTTASAGDPVASSTQDPQKEESADIIVTATKRPESTQRVPIAIGVLSGERLQSQGVSSLLQMESLIPGVNLAKGPTSSGVAVTVRGLGTSSGVSAFDSSVGLFADGFYLARGREFSSGQFDVERIEVVRGTQAALLGKNTSLGAINAITRKPGDRFAFDGRVNHEFELNSNLVSLGVDIPLLETLALRVAGQYSDQGAFVTNTIGKDGLETLDRAIRGVLVWKPTGNVTATAVAQLGTTKYRGSPVEQVSVNANTIALQALAGFPGTLDSHLDHRNAMLLDPNGTISSERLRVNRYTLTVDWDLGPASLTSATSYSNYDDDANADVDMLAGRYGVRTEKEKGTQFTQELRLVSSGNTPFQYLIGGLYVKNILNFSSQVAFDYPFLKGTYRTLYRQETPTYSAFGQVTWRIVKDLRVLGGLRYTHEKKTGDYERRTLVPGNAIGVYPAYAPFRLRRTENNVDYSVGIQYDVANGIMAYASYGQGTKGGGYAPTLSRLDRSEYLKEVAKTAEIGVKMQNRSAGWLLNLGLFDTKVDDFQVVTFNGSAFQVNNADLRSRGVEAEASLRVMRDFKLFGNAIYAHARDRVTDNPIPLSPKFQGSAGFNAEVPIASNVKLLADGSVDHRSSRYSQQNPLAAPKSSPFTTLNLSVAVATAADTWELRLIGRNLTDANSINFAFGTPNVGPGAASAIPERPRTIALQLSSRF